MDGLIQTNSLTAILDLFNKNPDIDVLYGNAHHIDSQDEILEHYYTETWNIERLKEVCYLCQPAVFFRRSVIERFGMLDEHLQFCMDYEYWLRLAQQNVHFAQISQTLAGSRLHADTKTLGSRVKVHKEINDMLLNKLKCVPDRWLSNYAHAIAESNGDDLPARHLNRKIAIETIKAAFRWNKWISKPQLLDTLILLASSFRDKAIEKVKK